MRHINLLPGTEAERVRATSAQIPPVVEYDVGPEPRKLTPLENRIVNQALGGPDLDVHDWLNQPEQEYDYLIDGLLERGDRVIDTGGEGDGKTTLHRQIAVTAAAGIHPFTFDTINPVRVLYLDFENGKRFSRRRFRSLVDVAGDRLEPGKLIPIIRPEGIDLLTDEDQEWLEDRVHANLPELLIAGPLYKMFGGDPNSEEIARVVAQCLDRLRTTFELTIIIEAHSPYGTGKNRPIRPYGASLWRRWPEFGFHLSPRGALIPWRGSRDERDWPTLLERGGEWPWTAVADPREVLWARILEAAQNHLFRPSIRILEQELEVSRSSIQRVISAHSDEWKELWTD